MEIKIYRGDDEWKHSHSWKFGCWELILRNSPLYEPITVELLQWCDWGPDKFTEANFLESTDSSQISWTDFVSIHYHLCKISIKINECNFFLRCELFQSKESRINYVLIDNTQFFLSNREYWSRFSFISKPKLVLQILRHLISTKDKMFLH